MAMVEAMMVEVAVQLELIPEQFLEDCVALSLAERKMRGFLEDSEGEHKKGGRFQASSFSPVDYHGKIL